MELKAVPVKTRKSGKGIIALYALQNSKEQYLQKTWFGLVINFTPDKSKATTWEDTGKMFEWATRQGHTVTNA